MGDVGGDACLLTDGDDLGYGGGDALRLIADVRGVEATVFARHATQLDELVETGVGARRVGQTR